MRNFILIVVGFIIVTINIMLCLNSFYIRHNTGDQRAYVGIAAKIDKLGFKEYNLSRINMVRDGEFITYTIADKGDEGDLMRHLKRDGLGFYDIPLFFAPPLFTYTIVLSHKLFANKQPYRVVWYNESNDEITKLRPRHKLQGQFYCTIVPIFFSCLVILFCIFFGKYLFSSWVGIVSALLIMASPASILASQRIWADEMLALFVLLTIFLWCIAVQRNNLFFSGLAGVSFGLALLTKNNSLLLFLPIIACLYIFQKSYITTDIKFFHANLKLLLLLTAVFIVTIPWYSIVTSHYGTPFYNPSEPGISNKVSWFAFINQRPSYTYLIDILCQNPVYIIGYIAVLGTILRLDKSAKNLFLSVWFLSYLIPLSVITKTSEMLGPDQRYMLPAYPPLAILTAKYLDGIRSRIDKRGSVLGSIFIIAIVIASCYWSVKLGISYSLIKDEIIFPF